MFRIFILVVQLEKVSGTNAFRGKKREQVRVLNEARSGEERGLGRQWTILSKTTLTRPVSGENKILPRIWSFRRESGD